jgi:hypothetical protein
MLVFSTGESRWYQLYAKIQTLERLTSDDRYLIGHTIALIQ